jgi:hypothetical protein
VRSALPLPSVDIAPSYQRYRLLLAVGLFAGGCGGNAVANPTQRQGGSPDAAPQVGTEGSAPVPEAAVTSPESDAGSAATLQEAALARCEDELSGACASEQLVLSELRFDDASGDELLSPGEQATVMVTLQNASLSEPSGHCLGLVADAELVVLGSQNLSGVAWACAFEAVAPGETVTFSWQVQVDALAQVGSSVHLLAYVSMGQTECACSDSPWLYRTVTIG